MFLGKGSEPPTSNPRTGRFRGTLCLSHSALFKVSEHQRFTVCWLHSTNTINLFRCVRHRNEAIGISTYLCVTHLPLADALGAIAAGRSESPALTTAAAAVLSAVAACTIVYSADPFAKLPRVLAEGKGGSVGVLRRKGV